MLGLRVGSYTVIAKLGEGGMGVVYLAEHSVMKRKAVVKVLRQELTTNEEIARRFINEATAAASIRHPGIVDVMDVGTHERGFLFILMEFLDGEGLADRIRRLGVLSPEQAVSITRQAAGALSAAHRANIVHRDLKPDNLFVVPVPDVRGGERVKVLDFGIAKLSGEGMASLATRTGTMMGTPVYMSPEQCRGAGSVDHRSDLYSLGCILFEMLTGRPPFVGEGIGDLISSHMKEPPPTLRSFNATLPASLEPVVERLLRKKADDRYQSCDELVAALDALEANVASTAAFAPTISPYVAPALATPAPAPGVSTGPTIAAGPAPTAAIPNTTLGGSAAAVGGHATAATPRPRWVLPAALVGLVAVVGIIVAVTISDGNTQRDSAAANERAVTRTDAVEPDASNAPSAMPVVSGLGPNGRITAAREALVAENWAGMLEAADEALAVAPDNAEARELKVQAESELRNELLYGKFVVAVSRKDHPQIGALFRKIDAESVYNTRARPDHDRMRDQYVDLVGGRGAALVAKGNRCKELKRLANDAGRAWNEAKAVVAPLVTRACDVTRTRRDTEEGAPRRRAVTGCLDEVGCLLADRPPSCCSKYKTKTRTETKNTDQSDLPTQLSEREIKKGMGSARSRVTLCGDKHPAKGTVKITVKVAPNGKISSVRVKSTPNSALGACVKSAVERRAKFIETQKGRTFTYPFVFRG